MYSEGVYEQPSLVFDVWPDHGGAKPRTGDPVPWTQLALKEGVLHALGFKMDDGLFGRAAEESLWKRRQGNKVIYLCLGRGGGATVTHCAVDGTVDYRSFKFTSEYAEDMYRGGLSNAALMTKYREE